MPPASPDWVSLTDWDVACSISETGDVKLLFALRAPGKITWERKKNCVVLLDFIITKEIFSHSNNTGDIK